MNDLSALGFRMPAEWEKQKSTIVAWPHNKNDWPGLFNNIPDVFAKIVSEISKVENVNLLIQKKEIKKDIINLLIKNHALIKNVYIHVIPTDRVWVRDSGPIYVKNKQNKKIILNWKFNAWAKYNNYKKDNLIPSKISKIQNIKTITPKFIKNGKILDIVLEGGSIDVNGKNILMTTKECLLSKVQARNPRLNQADLELIFKKYLGYENIIWLNQGILGDDTHGHVDDISRFVDTKTIFTAVENNKRDGNTLKLKENLKTLNQFLKKNWINNIYEIPMPKVNFIQKTRVPASYLNFYICNNKVLVPIFEDKNDDKVINLFEKFFKKRKIVPINCKELIWGFGAIHCMTQQEPA